MRIKSLIKHIIHPTQLPQSSVSSSLTANYTLCYLSNNDQIMPRIHTQFLLFYQHGQGVAAPLLKTSLPHVLALFPPLAGTFIERSHGGVDIRCNNKGTELWVACAEGTLQEFKDFQPNSAFRLLSPVASYSSIAETPILLAQVTEFECGGVALVVAMHHHAGDGLSLCLFLQVWAHIAMATPPSPSGSGSAPPLPPPLPLLLPSLVRSLLKARDPPTPHFEHVELQLGAQTLPSHIPAMTARIFTFHDKNIQTLKQMARKGDSFTPTSFEALAGYLWRSITKAREVDLSQVIKFGMAVDGRKRFDPPLPEGYFGNVNFYGCAISEARKLIQEPLLYAASLVHEAVKRVDDEYMRSALDWVEQQDSPLSIRPGFDSFLGVDLAITSWVKFPLYQMDFGWGRPVFATIPASAFDGLVVLLPSRKAGAVNAIIGLQEEHMARLMQDLEFFLQKLEEGDALGC